MVEGGYLFISGVPHTTVLSFYQVLWVKVLICSLILPHYYLFLHALQTAFKVVSQTSTAVITYLKLIKLKERSLFQLSVIHILVSGHLFQSLSV